MRSVKFSKEFVTSIGTREWITLEWPVDEPFNEGMAMETFTKVKAFVCNYQSTGIPVDQTYLFQPGPPTTLPVIDKAEERLEILIDNAATLDELYQYFDKASGGRLFEIYQNRFKKLTNK